MSIKARLFTPWQKPWKKQSQGAPADTASDVTTATQTPHVTHVNLHIAVATDEKPKDSIDPDIRPRIITSNREYLKTILKTPTFEVLVALLVLLSSVIVALETLQSLPPVNYSSN